MAITRGRKIVLVETPSMLVANGEITASVPKSMGWIGRLPSLDINFIVEQLLKRRPIHGIRILSVSRPKLHDKRASTGITAFQFVGSLLAAGNGVKVIPVIFEDSLQTSRIPPNDQVEDSLPNLVLGVMLE